MKFILFEGVNGSGKTTLAKKLTDRVKGVYYDSPPECIKDLRKKGIITSDERLLIRDGRIKEGEIEFLDKVAQKMEFLLDNRNVICIDTTHRCPEELVDLIVQQIF